MLAKDERLIWAGRMAWTNFLGSILLGFVLFVFGLLMWGDAKLSPVGEVVFIGGALIVWMNVWIQRLATRYEVTTQRAIVERGLFSRHVSEIELANVQDLQLRQTFFQRLCRVGTLEVSSAGRDTAEVVLVGITYPDAVKEVIRQGMRRPQSGGG